MNSIFASHKGRIFKKIFIGALAVAFVSMVLSANEEPETNTTSNASVVDQTPQVGAARVYVDPEKKDDTEDEEPTGEEEPTEDDDQRRIIAASRTPVEELVSAWVSYDYNSPTDMTDIPGFPQDSANQSEMKPKYDEWVKNMKDKQELSTGQVSEVELQSIDYSGSPDVGSGTATFTVTVNTTITNKDVGSAGTNVVKRYTVVSIRLDDTTTDDNNDWFVKSIEESG